MRQTRRAGNFLFNLLLNLLLNAEGALPAVLLLLLHFALDWSLWWAAAALGLWILIVALRTLFLRFAVRCGNRKDPPRENKNPYSVREKKEKHLRKELLFLRCYPIFPCERAVR